MKYLKFSVAVLVVAVALTCSCRAMVSSKSVDSVLAAALSKYKVPAIAASVITPDEMVYSAAGKIRMDSSGTVSVDSKFHLGSNTKAITAFMIMKEAERGRINPDSRIGELFPEMGPAVRAEYADKTLMELLLHQAGVRPFTTGAEVASIPEMSGTLTQRRLGFSQYVLDLEPVTSDKPYNYSNAGYVVAAAALEKATGKSWEDLLKETMDSLGISYYKGFPNRENIKNPWGHWIENGALKALPPGHFYALKDILAPAGDIAMSISNYSRWLQYNLEGLLGRDNYLKAATWHKLHYAAEGYALGWLNNTDDIYGRVSTHDGSAGTYYCHAAIYPEKKIAIAVMANSADNEAIQCIYYVREQLLKLAVQ